MVLPDDFRNGIYTDGSVIATVDVRCSKNEILMHDEITDKTFILTPHELSKWEKIGTKDMLYDEKTNMAFPVKMSLDEFYAKNGCLFFVSGDLLDKCRFPHGRT